jgi:ubiquinone/menaquinone biosynthesis C-methylase UbiE
MIRRLAHRVVARPVVYDLIQRLAGADEIRRRVSPFLADSPGPVLDLAGGTGAYRDAVPAATPYLLLDLDPEKVSGFRAKRLSGDALVSDATALCLRDQSVDAALCLCAAHHLDDAQLRDLFAEAARVVRRRLVLVDPLRTDRVASRLLWRYDRGSNPRVARTLAAAMSQSFVLEHSEQFRVFHTYALLVGTPRRARRPE